MTAVELGLLLLYVLMTLSAGGLVLRVAGRGNGAGGWSQAFLAGQLIWLNLFLVCMWLRLPADLAVWGVGGAALATAGLLKSRDGWRIPRSACIRGLVLAAVMLCFFLPAVLQTLRGPLLAWDARSIWFFHGKAIWYGNGIQAAHFSDPRMALFHTDYPLLIPVQAAVLGVLNGGWSEMAVKSFLLVNLAAYVGLLAAVLHRRCWPGTAAWGAAVLTGGFVQGAYVNGYADNHYALPLAVAALLLVAPPGPSAGSRDLPDALLLCGFALNVKNEALWYTVLILVVAIAFRGRPRLARGVWVPLVIGMIPLLLWGGFKAVHGIENDLGMTRHLAAPVEALRQCVDRLSEIRMAMGVVHGWMRTLPVAGLWLVLAGGAAYTARASGDAAARLVPSHELVLWLLFFAVHALLFVTYGLTPYNVSWHLGTSLDRLLVFPCLLLAMLVISAVERALDVGPPGNSCQ